ncbi:MAG: hydroxymethylbilane synthase [Rhodocyclaceae bacterium]|nr:hydroxymethylbilane synthase [Rhodocyclaceae bacterium]
MTPTPERLVIATRESRLALWQADYVRGLLAQLYPHCRVELLGLTTRGDQILDRPLAQVGGKGLFVKELEVAMAEGRADLAVHSAKDVPMELPPGFVLVATLARVCAHDAFVSNRYEALEEMPPGAVVGTSSLRRQAQLAAQYPYLSFASLRGNLDTRLRKLDEGHYDAIILAAAGLERLGLQARIRGLLPLEVSLPAPGQGLLAIEAVSSRRDIAAWLAPLADSAAAVCLAAERAVARGLAGSCEVPLAAYAEIDAEGKLWLRARIAMPDGSQMLSGERRGLPQEAETLGAELAAELLHRGADEILSALTPRVR